jgi:hypothetical protein
MRHFQDPRPIEELKSNATVAQRVAKINELVRLLNAMWFTDDAEHTS